MYTIQGVISTEKLSFYTSNELKPAGWLRRQLEIQAAGLSGHLDKIWPDIADSAWIGGTHEGWERVPYWLDGFVPLAYLLEDEDMIGRARRYIYAIIEAQKPDGWLCPCEDAERTTYDTWAVLLMSKVLTVYYECSQDPQIPTVLYRMLKNYYELLSTGAICLHDWGEYRWFEGFVAINFLYDRCHEAWLPELSAILKKQGADYSRFTEQWKRPLNRWRYDTHIVNIAMMLKAEAVSFGLLGEGYTDKAEQLYRILDQYNGTPVGLFTGDECLSGLSPIQGTELCAVVELMYSYELLYAYTGDKKWAERLEVIAFNALPAAISEDMWTHQYDQMSNQIACETFPGKPIFRTNREDAHLFGLEPHFGCCTANFNQGWPKLALSAFMHRKNTVVSAVPIPSVLKTADYTIRLETNYPFENRFTYHIQATAAFTFKVRIPSFAEHLTVNGVPQSGDMLSFDIPAGADMTLEIAFETTPTLTQRPHDLHTVQCGSLVFSVPIRFEKRMLEYVRDGVERKFPYCDYELIPQSDWNYAYCGAALEVERRPVGEVPFSVTKPPVMIRTKAQKIDWGFEDGYDTVCAKVPTSTAPLSAPEEIELHPYGCAKLRMTELPLADGAVR